MRILLVDDSHEVRRQLRLLLGEMPDTEIVGEAATVSRAIELAPNCNPEVVILDLRLPDGCGFEVLERLRLMTPTPKVVVLTNYPDAVFRRRSAELGAECLIDKSKEIDQLGRVLESLCRELGGGGMVAELTAAASGSRRAKEGGLGPVI